MKEALEAKLSQERQARDEAAYLNMHRELQAQQDREAAESLD